MIRNFKIKKIVKKSDSPFILTINNTNQLIGDKARALEGYMMEGMNIKIEGHTHGKDFLIEQLNFTDGVQKGAQLDIIA